MAGIGFTLKKYFKDVDLMKVIEGSVYSVFIATGPWLITILSIAIISIFAREQLQDTNLLLFKSIISYSYAFSLIFFGLIEMPITRYLADKLFLKDTGIIKPVFIILMSSVVVISAIVGYLFYSFSDFDIFTKITCVSMFCSIMVIWTCMIFLSAAKNYKAIAWSFLLGGGISVLASYFLGSNYQLLGYVLGYTLGQFSLAITLCVFIFLEYKSLEYLSLDFLSYFKKHRYIMAAGLFYYLGIWIDKFVFWYSKSGLHIKDLFYTNQYYDTAMFFAYLTIIPSFVIFLVQIETNFYVKFSSFFSSIENKENLRYLDSKIDEMVESLKRTLKFLIKVQTFITIFCWYFSDEILAYLQFPGQLNLVFKYGVIGSYFHVIFLTINIILLYFEAEKMVLKNYIFFFLSNFILTVGSELLGVRFWGFGYALSSFLVLLLSIYHINHRLLDVNFYVFMGQPLSRKNFSEEI